MLSALQTIKDIKPMGVTEQGKNNLAIAFYDERDPEYRIVDPGEFPQFEAWRMLRNLPKFPGLTSPGNIPALNRLQTGASRTAPAADEYKGFR
jgi:hypothetical protein